MYRLGGRALRYRRVWGGRRARWLGRSRWRQDRDPSVYLRQKPQPRHGTRAHSSRPSRWSPP